MTGFRYFSQTNGPEANLCKSQIHGNGVDEDTKQLSLSIVNFQLGQFHIKHLGGLLREKQ